MNLREVIGSLLFEKDQRSLMLFALKARIWCFLESIEEWVNMKVKRLIGLKDQKKRVNFILELEKN